MAEKKRHGAPELPFPWRKAYPIAGSAADDLENAFVTPFDVKWDYLINWDHEFIGKEALLNISKNPPRTCVTLEWNAEDVGKVYATQFMDRNVEPCDDLSNVGDVDTMPLIHVISKVLKDGKMIGVTAGRIQK